eukprot:TRINITY_DN1141_c0_g1_i4.p1 TRINITY_DN1141_c0_g1~~TRINITY_DN1141_c0_g1_i4.p1  ORF type:complete len:346 (-),score=102.07 TRINITY_DN1141_c0_g1_i4:176-1213(-)
MGLKTILDFSVEDALDEEACDRNAAAIIEATKQSKGISGISFSCVKVSAICPGNLLTRVSSLLRAQNADPSLRLPWKEETPGFLIKPESSTTVAGAPEALSAGELESLGKLFSRMEQICQACSELDIPLLVDAEYTHQQPAIDYLTMAMTAKYNKKRPLVYNTYQMYLRDSFPRLEQALEESKRWNFHFGGKLVRGAYLVAETKVATEQGLPSPCFQQREDTHDNYNKAIELLLSRRETSGMMFATHNQTSVELAVNSMKTNSIPNNHPNIHFAQLYGMGLHLSTTLAQQKFNINKYVPYGPVESVIPYLIRRIQENKDMLGGTEKERTLLKKELSNRLTQALVG